VQLVDIELGISAESIPQRVEELIADARQRIDAFDEQSPAAIPAFIPSDFELVYLALVAIDSARLAAGRRFIEWGSGIGVVTCLAESVGFDAVGIEIEPRLVEIAESLADEHGFPVQFAQGSFLPRGAEPRLDRLAGVTWLSLGGADGYEELELDPDDFDVVFAYPWPGEEQVIFDLFADSAAVGALLLTYHGQEGVRLQRKVRG
jgi:predicted O-methyltransferase YrrM